MKLTSHALQRLAAAAITGTVILLPAVALASVGPAATVGLPASGARPALPAAAYVASNGSDAVTPVGTAGTWKLLPAAPVTAVPGSVVSVWTGREMIIHGSLNGQPVTFAYRPAAGRWKQLADGPAASGGQTEDIAVWTGSRMLVPGLTNGAYNPVTDTWRTIARDPYAQA